ncbi:MAG: Gfo/Idh/MocA family protein [Promethearchaeota archaeon]
MKMYSVLIIGAGKQASEADHPNSDKIISFAHAFKKYGQFEVIFYDIDIQKAYKSAEKWDAHWIGDYKKHLSKYDVDIIVVTTTDETHYEILKDIVYYKPKLVLTEKPITTNLDQAYEIVELYKNNNIPLMVNYTRRFLPYYQDLKQRYENDEFGELTYYNIIYNRGLLHTGTHGIDFMIWFLGMDRYDDWKLTEANDNYRVWQIQLFFEEYFWQEQRILNMPVWDYYDKSHWHIVDNIYKFLQGEEDLKCTGKDALKALEIAFHLKGAN